MNCVVEDPAYSRLKDYIVASTGLAYYSDRDQLLTEVISGRLGDLGLRDCSGYAKLLADGEKGGAEMDVLVGLLTIGETSFFRDKEAFAAIRDVVLEDILERKQSSRQLRIWSAGCATGAEPYSLAIILMDELAGRIAGWQVAIHATDLNPSCLAQAEQGTFRAWALHTTSDKVKAECFSREGFVWTIHPRYKAWISFQRMNLAEGEFSTPWPEDTYFDLILCRNVMIYFAPELNRRLIGQFHERLVDGGWLMVGSSEHNPEKFLAFRTVSAPGARLYQKLALPLAAIEAPRADVARPVVAQEVMPEPVFRAPVLQTEPFSPAAPVFLAEPAFLAEPVLPAEPGPDGVEGLRQLVDHGRWQEGAEYGQGLLTRDKLNPEIHFYRALIFEHLGIVDQAEQSLRRAIYLDRNFALAHYHLGLAMKRNGQISESARSFGNVLRVLAALPDEALVRSGAEVTAVGLRELATMHLERSSGA